MGADYKPRRARIVTGTYEGDGAGIQAIAGLGFQPIFVIIYAQFDGGTTGTFMKANIDGLNTSYEFWTGIAYTGQYEPDYIISLDADGFTIGDGTGGSGGNSLNVNLRDYTFIAFG